MDPITMLILGGIGAALGTTAQMRGQARENQVAADQENRRLEADQRRAAKMEDVAGMMRQFGASGGAFGGDLQAIARALQSMSAPDNRGTLEAEARRQLERNSGMLDSALASRGVYSSGYGVTQQNLLASETLGSLAQAIAADRQQGLATQMAGQQAAAGIYGNLNAQQLAALQGMAALYSDPAMGTIGMQPYRVPQPTGADYFLGFLGGGLGGAANVWGQDPGAFS